MRFHRLVLFLLAATSCDDPGKSRSAGDLELELTLGTDAFIDTPAGTPCLHGTFKNPGPQAWEVLEKAPWALEVLEADGSWTSYVDKRYAEHEDEAELRRGEDNDIFPIMPGEALGGPSHYRVCDFKTLPPGTYTVRLRYTVDPWMAAAYEAARRWPVWVGTVASNAATLTVADEPPYTRRDPLRSSALNR